MQTPQIIALLGATGKAGKYILKGLLKQGYRVKCLIRHPEAFSIQHPRLMIVAGDAVDYFTIDNLLKDCQAVISAIGQRQGEPLVASLVSRNIITAMERQKIRRYIFLSGLNLDVPGDAKSADTEAKSAWMRQHFPDAVADKQQAFELIAASDTDWTMIRLPMLEPTDERRGLKVSFTDSVGNTISAADLAAFTISLIDDFTYHRKAPFVGN